MRSDYECYYYWPANGSCGRSNYMWHNNPAKPPNRQTADNMYVCALHSSTHIGRNGVRAKVQDRVQNIRRKKTTINKNASKQTGYTHLMGAIELRPSVRVGRVRTAANPSSHIVYGKKAMRR